MIDFLITGWLMASIAVGITAHSKDKSGMGWSIISMLASPLIGALLLIVAVMPKPAAEPTPNTHVRCPDCRELVRRDASACKHCGCRLTANA